MAYGKLKADTLVYDNSGSDVEVTLSSLGNKAPLASPTFTGTPAAPTAADGVNNTQIATTAFVHSGYATKLSPTFSGTPAAPTASAGTNNTQIATTAYVDTSFAPKASPALTGTATGVNLTLSGNLTVNGTTTTINSTTLTVDDKNIELGTVDTPTDTTADGGGITLKGATDKEIKWVNATDAWTFNQDIEVTSGVATLKGIEGGSATLYLISDEGDDNGDNWKIIASAGDNNLYFENKTSGSYATKAIVTEEGAVHDSKGDVRKIIQNDQANAYTLVAADAGKHVLAHNTITIPNSLFAAGDAVTIINNIAGDITLTASVGALYNTADGATGNRTLAARGMATILFISATTAYISGAGLS